MRWLSDHGYHAITLDELVDGRAGETELPPRSVVITFDDGFSASFDHAVPILEREGFVAVFFVVAGLVGDVSRWQIPLHGRAFPLMAWDAILRLQGKGFVLGSHTVTHPNLARLPVDECRDELVRSRQILEKRLGRPVVHLAYPFGSLDERVRQLALEAGYRVGCSVRSAVSRPDEDPLALPRVAVRGSYFLEDFVERLVTLEEAARASAPA